MWLHRGSRLGHSGPTAPQPSQRLASSSGCQSLAVSSVVRISDGNSERLPQIWRKIGHFGEEKIRFVNALDLNKCLTRAPISELLSDKSTLVSSCFISIFDYCHFSFSKIKGILGSIPHIFDAKQTIKYLDKPTTSHLLSQLLLFLNSKNRFYSSLFSENYTENSV